MSRLKDIETSARIKLALVTNQDVNGFDIGVETVNGIVVLNGAVQYQDQKDLVHEVARTHGAIDIKNDIRVLADSPEALGLIGQLVTEPDVLLSEDVSITERILGDLESDSRVNSLMINVEQAGSVVRLSGIQDTEVARVRAQEVASRVPGVTEVINDIEVVSRSKGRHAA